MAYQYPGIKRLIAVRLNPGDDILEGLERAVSENGIVNGMIMNGAGSVSRYHFHIVDDPRLPPREAFVSREKACDVIGMSGMIIDGRVHAHITLSTAEIALGGHVEPGCTVLTFCMIIIAEAENASFSGWDSIRTL